MRYKIHHCERCGNQRFQKGGTIKPVGGKPLAVHFCSMCGYREIIPKRRGQLIPSAAIVIVVILFFSYYLPTVAALWNSIIGFIQTRGLGDVTLFLAILAPVVLLLATVASQFLQSLPSE